MTTTIKKKYLNRTQYALSHFFNLAEILLLFEVNLKT